jgi:large subunit ribosomal protein L10
MPSRTRSSWPAETGTRKSCSVPCLARGFSYRPFGWFEAHDNATGAKAPAVGKVVSTHLNRTDKEKVISELHEKMARVKIAIVAEPKGLNVATVNGLRKKLRDSKVEYRVIKNSLAALAAKGTTVEKVADKFVGPTAIVMSYDDVIAPAKVLADFMKDRESFTIRTAVVDGKIVDAKGILALAKLPGLLELRGQIATMIAQPASKLVRMIAAPGQQLARVLAARRDQLEKGL